MACRYAFGSFFKVLWKHAADSFVATHKLKAQHIREIGLSVKKIPIRDQINILTYIHMCACYHHVNVNTFWLKAKIQFKIITCHISLNILLTFEQLSPLAEDLLGNKVSQIGLSFTIYT